MGVASARVRWAKRAMLARMASALLVQTNGFGCFVMQVDVIANGRFQFPDAAENTAPDALVGDLGKPSLHQIDPGTVGGREVQVETRTPGKLFPAGCRFVGAVVVQDQVNVSSVGTSASSVLRNWRNSCERWRRCSWPMMRLL
jgi:hypothetical protein